MILGFSVTLRHLRNIILTADLAWGVLAMPLAYLMRYGWVWHGPTDRSAVIFIPPLMASLLIWSLMSSWVQLDGFRAGWKFPAVVSQLLLAVSGLMSALFTMAFLLREYISRLALGYFGVLLFLGFLVIRVVARSILASPSTQGLIRNVVIVGNGLLAREMVRKIESHPEMLRRVVGFLSPDNDATQSFLSGDETNAAVFRTVDVAAGLKARGVDEIILTVSAPGHPEILDLTSRCNSQGIAVSMVPQPYELYVTKTELADLDGLPLLQLPTVSLVHAEPFWKRSFDIISTVAVLPICIPLMLVGATILKMKKGKAFCSERRCGKQGKEFLMYRLNSSRKSMDLPPYERLLQKLSITELPQVFNVLRGEMSLVGPRPEGIERARHYTDWHRQRLNVKPGITGLAQVDGLRDQHSSEDKTRYDLQYILHRSAFQDISLLLQTGWTLVIRLLRKDRLPPAAEKIAVDNVYVQNGENLVHAHSSQSSAD
jgi:lipopolysaccharide/colanic/teichoic acid biosynthesis glycosyltransferase